MVQSLLNEISNPAQPRGGHRERTVHVAVISANDGVVSVLCDWTSNGLLIRLSRYVEENAVAKLWPEVYSRVRELVRVGKREAAIELYFKKVGERWDVEFLHREAIHLPPEVFLEWTDL